MQDTLTSVPKEGDAAPKFKLPAYPSGTISLDDFIGKKNVLLAFYPKDDTPGCTKEMCAFSSDLTHFEEANTQVLGISCDSVQSHERFSGKFSLKQPLLADVDGRVGKSYGTVSAGKNTASRKLFVIDKKGVIKHIYEGMPDNQTLLSVVKSL
jgi:peroxiredoxin Q/BCP